MGCLLVFPAWPGNAIVLVSNSSGHSCRQCRQRIAKTTDVVAPDFVPALNGYPLGALQSGQSSGKV